MRKFAIAAILMVAIIVLMAACAANSNSPSDGKAPEGYTSGRFEFEPDEIYEEDISSEIPEDFEQKIDDDLENLWNEVESEGLGPVTE